MIPFEDEEQLLEMRKQDAHREGYKACQDGLYQEDNPYDLLEEPELHDAWEDGFWDARFDE